MKLVIDISEETYKAIMKPFSTFKEQRTHKSVITEACIAIANGKPQEQKTGHWKRISIDKYVQHAMAFYKCSECGKDIIGEHNYCPNCGSAMIEPQEREVAESNSTYCTECPYFNKVIYDGEQWFGARCDKDGHSTMPSMYAIKSLHNDCPLVAEVEPQESEE